MQLPKTTAHPYVIVTQHPPDASAPSWEQLSSFLPHTNLTLLALEVVKMCLFCCASELSRGYLESAVILPAVRHCWISNSRSLGAVTTHIGNSPGSNRIATGLFCGSCSTRVAGFWIRKGFLKSLSKFPPKQDCQAVLCTSFLTHYQLVTFPF